MAPLADQGEQITRFPFNPFRIAMLDDPYPAYAALRTQCPVYWVPGCLGRDWILSRYTDVQRVLSDPRCGVDNLPFRIRQTALTGSSEEQPALSGLADILDSWLFFLSGSEHKRIHRVLSPRLTPMEIAKQRVAIRRRAEELIDALVRSESPDLMDGFACRLPMLVGLDLLGAQVPDLARFIQMGQDLFSVFTVPTPLRRYRRISQQATEVCTFVSRLIAHKRHQAGDDLASDLARRVDQGELQEHEAVSLAAMVLSVGQDTTQHLIGNALEALLSHPDQLDLLRAQPALMPGAVKELARFNTPVQVVVHIARAPIEMESDVISAGERIHFYLAAAHRDSEVFVRPEKLELTRDKHSRLLFGAGPHFCLGAHLALLTTEVAISALLERFPHLYRARETRPRWIKSLHMRGLTSLPVSLS